MSMVNTDPTEDPRRVLAERVRALRISTGRSQRGLAREIFLSHTMVNRVETGYWPISWETVWAVVTGCGVPETDRPLWRDQWSQALDVHASRPVVPESLVQDLTPAVVPQTHRDAPTSGQASLFDDDFDYAQSKSRFLHWKSPFGSDYSGRNSVPRRGEHFYSYRSGLFKPDRDRVRTVPEYVDALRQLRASVNNPSWRQMADRSRSSHNTLHDLVRPGRVELKWDVVEAFLVGCGLKRSEIVLWYSIFRRLRVRPRPKSFRRSDPHTPPPRVDLTDIGSVPRFVEALKELAGASKRSTDEIVRTAQKHPGAQILCRSALFGRFKRAITTGELPERDVVVGYLRGCYCRTLGRRCAPDCNADLIAPWLRIYDELHQHAQDQRPEHNSEPLWHDARGVA